MRDMEEVMLHWIALSCERAIVAILTETKMTIIAEGERERSELSQWLRMSSEVDLSRARMQET